MSLMAVFNCSFLITLILFLLIIGLIWIHFNQKINDQNIKMNQMVHLLTTMTQEVSLLRQKVGLSFNEEIIDISEDNIKEEKIDVSDNESESDESDDDNSDDSDIDDSVSDSDDSVKLEEEPDEKLINNIDISSIELVEELKSEQLNQLEEQLIQLEEQLNKLEETTVEELVEEIKETVEDNKEELVEDNTEDEQPDKEEYKKMSLNKLKALVLEKKLTSDVSKLKKSDLLTILGIDV